MKVLVAGATGAVGLPTVRALIDAGHEVVGTTRSDRKRGLIESAGAGVVVMDALDTESVRRAVTEVKPDGIVQLLTDLPKRGPVRASELTRTNTLRIDGTRNLVAAAKEASVGRYVSESIVLGYVPSRDRAATEDDPFADNASARSSFAEPLRALAYLDEQVRGIGGVVLRMGLYYGQQSGSQQFMTKLARRRMLMMPKGNGLLPWVHVEDVASAVVAALEHGRPGEAYNIVGDEPATTFDLASAVARSVGSRPPRKMPRWLVRLALPYMASTLDQSFVVSNDKAKRELGWKPKYPSVQAAFSTAV